jgi:hypothetical protein
MYPDFSFEYVALHSLGHLYSKPIPCRTFDLGEGGGGGCLPEGGGGTPGVVCGGVAELGNVSYDNCKHITFLTC